jgi:hypothetical protein
VYQRGSEKKMNWFYATKEKTQAGPVDQAALEGLFRAGAITEQTLIWKEGMASWAPYSSVLPLPSAAQPVAVTDSGLARCAECGQTFPPDQMISLGGRTICGACKPVAVQKLQEGAVSFGQTVDPEVLWQQIQQRGYDFTIGSILSRSWKLVTGNLWPCIGVTLLCYLIMVGAQQIPILGLFAMFLVQPQIMAGLNWYFLKQFRGQPATLNDGFEGFRRGYGQQAIYMLIIFAIIFGTVFLCAVPAAIIVPIMASAAEKSGDGVTWILIAVLFVVFTPIVLAIWYFMICWFFTPLLILDKGLKATAAMKLSRRVVQLRFWKIFLLFLVIGLMCMLSLLALIVGIIFMLPIAFAALSRLYEDAFGDERPSA